MILIDLECSFRRKKLNNEEKCLEKRLRTISTEADAMSLNDALQDFSLLRRPSIAYLHRPLGHWV